MKDPRSGYVASLHAAYRKGKLNVFVGAGISQGSGFPGWEAMNKALLQGYLASAIGSATPAALVATPYIGSTVDALYSVLGRDSVADFVRHAAPQNFDALLAAVLYQGRQIGDLPVGSVHYQISALTEKARVWTLNFDPLLELAMARRFPGSQWTDFRSPGKVGGTKTKFVKKKIEHLHGWIDPDGNANQLVLTESQYIELTARPSAAANSKLVRMLAGDNVTLIMGMSLADQNFRRVLYFLNKYGLSSTKNIFVVTVRQQPVVDHYLDMHWMQRGLRLLFLKNYEEIPGLLRDVQWGEPRPGRLPAWAHASAKWREREVPQRLIFNDNWQTLVHLSLDALCQQIREMFAVPQEEHINASLFVPFSDGSSVDIRMVGYSGGQSTANEAKKQARHRRLQIKKGREQGIAGVSFVSGTVRAVSYGEGDVDINFPASMRTQWVSRKGYRDWRSILSIPIIDTPYWLPVAVLNLTSSMADPFWSRFGKKQDLLEAELHAIIRRTAAFCLTGFAAVSS
ncbi:MAG: SIR2 family protein [Acidobacteriia bacterium]|nr:SIR2 family protein [Terriglobia bacterium]